MSPIYQLTLFPESRINQIMTPHYPDPYLYRAHRPDPKYHRPRI